MVLVDDVLDTLDGVVLGLGRRDALTTSSGCALTGGMTIAVVTLRECRPTR